MTSSKIVWNSSFQLTLFMHGSHGSWHFFLHRVWQLEHIFWHSFSHWIWAKSTRHSNLCLCPQSNVVSSLIVHILHGWKHNFWHRWSLEQFLFFLSHLHLHRNYTNQNHTTIYVYKARTRIPFYTICRTHVQMIWVSSLMTFHGARVLAIRQLPVTRLLTLDFFHFLPALAHHLMVT